MENWKTLVSEKALDRGKWLVVEDHTVGLPDGRTIANWPWVITPDYVNIAVEDKDGNFLCFRQTKYGVKDGTTLATVGGYIEPGEEPLIAAKRELLEEMGYVSQNWIFLGSYVVDGNRGVATAHLYLARQAEFVEKAESDDLEPLEVLSLSQAEVRENLLVGAFKGLSWTTTIALALQHL